MTLKELTAFPSITIQCHDNPDADSLASGYGLYCYFKRMGKPVRFIYSGQNQIQKPNLLLMKEKLSLPIEYIPPRTDSYHNFDGLLITVDCQYGEGNVTTIEAYAIAIIDHHQDFSPNIQLKEIVPSLGSCSTLVWKLLCQEQFPFEEYPNLSTALYYGLYADTNQFSELSDINDLEMRESLICDQSLISLFRNSNLTLKEFEIAAIAMLRYSYNDDYEFAVIHAKPCDPNILGLINDFLLQVAEVKTSLVFNETDFEYKLSVRSCIPEISASRLAAFLTEGIGSGGGHLEKAGGTINRRRYEDQYPTTHADAYFNNRMIMFFDSLKEQGEFDVAHPNPFENMPDGPS